MERTPLGIDDLVEHWTIFEEEMLLVSGGRGATRLGRRRCTPGSPDTPGSGCGSSIVLPCHSYNPSSAAGTFIWRATCSTASSGSSDRPRGSGRAGCRTSAHRFCEGFCERRPAPTGPPSPVSLVSQNRSFLRTTRRHFDYAELLCLWWRRPEVGSLKKVSRVPRMTHRPADMIKR